MRHLLSKLQLSYPTVDKQLKNNNFNITVSDKNQLVINAMCVLATTFLGYLLLTSQYMYPVSRWIVSEGFHGHAWLAIGLLTVLLLLPSVGTCMNSIFGIVIFAFVRGLAFSVVLLLLSYGDLWNRSNESAWYLYLIASIALLNSLSITPLITSCSLYFHLVTVLPRRIEGHTYDRFANCLSLYLGVTQNRSSNYIVRFYSYVGKIRRSRIATLFLGKHLLSTNITRAYERRTERFVQEVIESQDPGTEPTDTCIQKMLLSFEAEVALADIALQSGSKIDYKIMLVRGQFVFLVAAQALPLQPVGESIGIDVLKRILQLLARISSKGNLSIKDKLHQLVLAIESSSANSNIFRLASHAYVGKDESEHIFITSISSIFLERLGYLDHAWGLIENLDSAGFFKANDLIVDDEFRSRGLALARVCTAMALAQSKVEHHEEELHSGWAHAIDIASEARDKNSWEMIIAAKPDLTNRVPSCEQREPIGVNDHAKLRFAFGPLPSHFGGGDYISIFNIGVWLLIFFGLISYSISSTYLAHDFPLLTDPFRETKYSESETLSAVSLDSHIFIGTNNDGVHVIDTATYRIGTEPSSTKSDGPTPGAVAKMATSNNSGDLIALIKNGDINNSINQGTGIDWRDEDGIWSTIIAPSSVGDVSGKNLRDILEIDDSAIILIGDYLYGYDFTTRELFRISTNLKEIQQIAVFNGIILVLSSGQLYEAELDGRELYDKAIKLPSCFGDINDIETPPSLDAFIVKTSTGSVLQSKEILGQWRVIFGGDQWISKDWEAKNNIDVLDAGFDLTNRHMWLKLQSGVSIFFALKKEGDRFWSVSSSYTQQELIADIQPIIDVEGEFCIVAKQNGVAILLVNEEEPWIFNEEVLLWEKEKSGVPTNTPWVPLSLDSNVEYGVVVTEKRNSITRVTAYSWNDLVLIALGNSEEINVVAMSQPLQSDYPIIYSSNATDKSEVSFVQKKDAQTLIESKYNLKDRRPYGTNKLLFSLDKEMSIVDIGMNSNSNVAIIANKNGQIGLVKSDNSIEANGTDTMFFSSREPAAIRAGWDSGEGFEIVDKEGRSYRYSLSSGWIARDSYKIKPDSIQRRSDGILIALTEDSELVYHSEKSGWMEVSEARGNKYEKILPANRDTLLFSTDKSLSKLVHAGGHSFALISLKESVKNQHQIELPVNDAIFIKSGTDKTKLIITDSKGIVVYDFLSKNYKWKRYTVPEASDYRLYSAGEGALAWSKSLGHLLEIKGSYTKLPFYRSHVKKIDVNMNGDYVAMLDDGSVFLNGSSTKLVSKRTDVSATKATTATLVSGDIITISNGKVFKTESNQIVSQFAVLPSNVKAKELASLDKTFLVLGNNRSLYYFENHGSRKWKRILNFKADVLIELKNCVLAIDYVKNTAGIINSSFDLVNVIYPQNNSISGKELLDDAPAIEHDRQLYLASTYGVIAWRPKGESKFLAFPRRDTVKEFVVVNDVLFVRGEHQTYELIDGKFKTVFDKVAEKIVFNGHTEMFVFRGGLWNKHSTRQPVMFGSTGAKLGRVFDVLKFDDEDLLFIEEDGSFVKYGSTRQLINETQSNSGSIVDVDKISEDIFYTVHRVDNDLHDMKIITWRWENHSPSQIESKYITSYASKSNGTSLVKIMTQNGDIYDWNQSTDRWEKVVVGFRTTNQSAQPTNFLPRKSFGAFVLSQDETLSFYQPSRGSSDIFKIGNKDAKIKQIWPWGNKILALTKDDTLLIIEWSGIIKGRVIDEHINLLSVNDTNAVYLNNTEDITAFKQGHYNSSILVRGRSNSALTFFPGDTPTAMRVFGNSKELLYVFDSKSLFRYDGIRGEWSKISNWNEGSLNYKDLINPSIEMVGNKLWVVYDSGLLNPDTGKLYNSFGRPAVSAGSLVWIDAKSRAFMQDGFEIRNREWENPESNYVFGNLSNIHSSTETAGLPIEFSESKVKMINIVGSTMYFCEEATVLIKKAGAAPELYPPINGDPSYATNSLDIIGKEGIFVFGRNRRATAFLFDGTSYEVQDSRLGELIPSRKRGRRHTFKDNNGTLYQFMIEIDTVQGDRQLRLSKMDQEETGNEIFKSAIFFQSNSFFFAIDTKNHVWLRSTDKEPWQDVGSLGFAYTIDDIRIYESSEKIFFKSHCSVYGTRIYEIDMLAQEANMLLEQAYQQLTQLPIRTEYLKKEMNLADLRAVLPDFDIEEQLDDVHPRGVIDTDGWLLTLNPEHLADRFDRDWIISTLNQFKGKEIYSVPDEVDKSNVRRYKSQDGYLHSDIVDNNNDIELRTGRYRGAQLKALQSNSKGELLVELTDGSVLRAFSMSRNSSFSTLPNSFKSNGNYSFIGSRITRIIDGKKIPLGKAIKGQAFPTEMIRKEAQSFWMTDTGTYYFDFGGNLWYLPVNKKRLLVNTKFKGTAELRFDDLTNRLCVNTNSGVYSLEENVIGKKERFNATLRPLHKSISGQTGDLKWEEGSSGKLKFSVQVTTAGIRKWIPASIKSGGFEFDKPIGLSRQKISSNSTLGEVRTLIKVNGALYSKKIPSNTSGFTFNIRENNELVKDISKIVYAPFGRVKVSNTDIAYEIKTEDGKWQPLRIIDRTVFQCDLITDLLLNEEGTLQLECNNNWVVKQNKNEVLLSDSNYSGSSFEDRPPWPLNGLATSPITRKPSGSGYQYKTMLNENIDIEWMAMRGCFTIEALGESDLNIKVNPTGGVCSLKTLSGNMTFDSIGRVVGATSGGTSVELVSTSPNITVERHNNNGIRVTYKNINVVGGDKTEDFTFTWAVEGGKLTQNILKDVYIHENGSVSLLSVKKVRSHSINTPVTTDTYFKDERGIEFAHPRASQNRDSVLKATGNSYLKEQLWQQTSQSIWDEAKTKETDFSFSMDDEVDSISFERGAKNYPVVKFSLPKQDDVNLLGESVRIKLSQNGFDLDLPTKDACLLDGHLYEIKMGRVLKLDSWNSIARAKFGSLSSGFNLAYDSDTNALIVNSDSKELDAASLTFKTHIVENAYMFAPYVIDSGSVEFKFEQVSDGGSRIQWKPKGQEDRVLMLESGGSFDHDTLTGVECISVGKDENLLLATPEGVSIRDANSYKVKTILPLEKISNGSRKVVSNSDGSTYVFSSGKFQEYKYLNNILSPVGIEQPLVQTGFKTSDWNILWGPLGTLEFQNTNGTIQTPLQQGYLPGDRLLGSALIGVKDTLLVTDAGLHNKDRDNVYPVGISVAARAKSIKLRDHPLGAIVQYDRSISLQPLLIKKEVSIYPGSIEDRDDSGGGSIQISWNKKGLAPTFNYMRTSDSLPMPLTVRGGFESDYAESIDLVDEIPIAFLSDGIAICDASPPETIYVKEGISNHAVKTIQIFTDVHDNGEYALLSNGTIVGVDYIKNKIKYSTPKIKNVELVSVAANGARWKLTSNYKNEITLGDYKYRDIFADEIFADGQFSSDFVNSIWTDKEGEIWLKTNIAYEKWGGDEFDMYSTKLEELPSTPTSFEHNTISLVYDGSSYAIRELELKTPLPFAQEEPSLLEVGDSIWTVSSGKGKTFINWLRMWPNKWIDKRQKDQIN